MTCGPDPTPKAAGGGLDEFGEIGRLFLPLTAGAPEALGLKDDAAALPIGGDGSMLVVTTDTIVEGVHTPRGEDPAFIARKLLRVNLSDLAAKGAEPCGWFLNVAWPPTYEVAAREAFAKGLSQDTERFGLRLLGGDTVRGADVLVATATMLGKTSRLVPRAGARIGDELWVSGAIGDAGLGLKLALGDTLAGPTATQSSALLDRYRLPEPRLALASSVRRHASACADVSDGLLADARRIAIASAVRVEIDLGCVPLSAASTAWLDEQPDASAARVSLATTGDDYELVCACRPGAGEAIRAASEAIGLGFTRIGRVTAGQGIGITLRGEPIAVERLGYSHR